MSDPITDDEARAIIHARAAWLFGRRSKTGLVRKALRFVTGQKRIEAIIVVERDAADADSLLCTGEVAKAWRIDRMGVKQILPNDAKQDSDKHWRWHFWEVFFADGNETVIWNEWEAAGTGYLIRGSLKRTENKAEMVIKRRRTVLHGSAM